MNAVLDSDADRELHHHSGPGSRLREERERQQLAADKVAAQLHLNAEMINSLEKDEYDRLPGIVFVRGYVRNYARLLGVSDAPLLDDLKHFYPSDDAAKINLGPSKVKQEVRSSHGIVRLVTWLIIFSMVGLLGAWWWNYSQNKLSVGDTETTNQEQEQESTDLMGEVEPAPTVEQLLAPAELQIANELNSETKSEVAEAVEPVEVTKPAVVDETIETEVAASTAEAGQEPVAEPEVIAEPVVAEEAATEMEAAPEGSETGTATDTTNGVVLAFSKSCWIDIRDMNSGYKMIGNFSSGTRTLGGVGPYKVIIGNVKAVTMTIDGNEYNLRKHTNKGNVAKFVLKINKPEVAEEG